MTIKNLKFSYVYEVCSNSMSVSGIYRIWNARFDVTENTIIFKIVTYRCKVN